MSLCCRCVSVRPLLCVALLIRDYRITTQHRHQSPPRALPHPRPPPTPMGRRRRAIEGRVIWWRMMLALCIGCIGAAGAVVGLLLLRAGGAGFLIVSEVSDGGLPASLRARAPSRFLNTQSTDEIFDSDSSDSYYVFLQKFPLKGTFKMLFHTEVVVCPSKAFERDTVFLNTLESILSNLRKEDRASFAAVPKGQWTKQDLPTCVQMGYGGSSCPTSCCGAPHR